MKPKLRGIWLLFSALLALNSVAVYSQDLLVASRNSDQILRFDADGNYAGVFASGNGLDDPGCLGVGADGSVYAGMQDSSGVRRVLKWDAAGAFQYGVSASGLSALAGVASDDEGAIYASSQTNSEVVRWNADRSYYNTFAYGNGLVQPAGLTFGPDGKLYVASKGSGQVLVWNPDGTFDRVFKALGAGTTIYDIAFASGGDMYILMRLTGGDKGVGVYSSTGAYKRYHSGGAVMGSPSALALRPGDDAVFVSDMVSGVLQLGSDGAFRAVIPEGSSGLSGASGLRFREAPALSENALIIQGALANSDGSPSPDGDVQASFRFYDVESGGSAVWAAPQQLLAVSHGVFTARLDSVPSWLFARPSVWLETVIGSETLAPRQLLGAQGVAVRAVSSQGLRSRSGGALDFSVSARRMLTLGPAGVFQATSTGGATFLTSAEPSSGVRLAPGSGSWSTLSDAASKIWHRDVNPTMVAEHLAGVPITLWSYAAQGEGVRHIGPMADDFRRAFDVGESDHTISTVDPDGVSMAAVQGLAARVEEQQRTIKKLQEMIRALEEDEAE